MLSTINKQNVIDTFNELNIGSIFYIDMHKRVNENNNSYYFAFISLDLYDTEPAKNINKILKQYGNTRITYDIKNKQYWEVKEHIKRELRNKEKETDEMVTLARSFNPTKNSITDKEINSSSKCANLNVQLFKMSKSIKEEFHKEFQEDFYKDLNELLREVNLVCFGQQHYIDYYCN